MSVQIENMILAKLDAMEEKFVKLQKDYNKDKENVELTLKDLQDRYEADKEKIISAGDNVTLEIKSSLSKWLKYGGAVAFAIFLGTVIYMST